MKLVEQYNYEDTMLSLDEVLDEISAALEKSKAFSLGRYGHGEIAFLYQSDFNDALYAGATISAAEISKDLQEALKTTDIVGFHVSWGYAVEDRDAAIMTQKFLHEYGFKPTKVCSAFITHDMVGSEKFWKCIKNRRVALVGRRAEAARTAFLSKGVEIVYTTNLEGYLDLDRVCNELSEAVGWDIAILAAGIPATVLAPRLAKKTNKVVIDFGHALDMLIDGETFDYNKLVSNWKKGVNKRMLVSIVLAVFNGEKFIKEAIASILSQSYKDIELIIVNDGSTDSTKNILDKVFDNRVKVIHLQHNQGAANALNIGIKKAKGSWIAIQDADDIYHPNKIEEQVRHIILKPDLVGVGTLISCISGDPDITKEELRRYENHKNSFTTSESIKKKIYWGCPLTHSSVMFKKDVFWKVGGYDNSLKIAYDFDLWIKLLEVGQMENIPKALLDYRIHHNSLSNKNGLATTNEIQIASSRGIYRLLAKNGWKHPKVAVIGPLKALKNYMDNIAPASGLAIEPISYRTWQAKVLNTIKSIRQGRLGGLVILQNNRYENHIEEYASKYLSLNENLFILYNILL